MSSSNKRRLRLSNIVSLSLFIKKIGLICVIVCVCGLCVYDFTIEPKTDICVCFDCISSSKSCV